VHGIHAYNTTAAVIYLKLFNQVAAPDPAANTPVMTFAIPPNGSLDIDTMGSYGHYFTTGIGICLVTGAADLDNTAVAAGAVVGVNVRYV
jgi:hypothetical protein